jgi:Ca-activated chloride channel family protein
MRTIRILLPLLLTVPLFGSFQDTDFKISTDVNMVLLDVSVQNSRGAYVAKLPKSAFRVEEDGAQQPITSFANVDVPVEAGLVMDASGSMQSRRAEVNAAGVSFVQKSNPKDEIFVVNFNDTVTRGLPPSIPFTDNVQLLRAALATGVPRGRTVLYDAVALALHHLEAGHRDRKTLLLVTDGGDNRSQMRLGELMKMIRESHATIYTVGLYDPDDPYRNPGVLRRIAGESGGECFLPKKSEDVVPICEKIAQDIRNRYTIGYVPKHTGSGVRTLRVTAMAPALGKLTVRSRTSYELPDADSHTGQGGK